MGYMDTFKLEGIIGQRIVAVELDGSDDVLRITTDKGTYVLVSEGDCCSESWFDKEHMEGVDLVLGQVVTGYEVRPEYEPADDRTRQECDKAYGAEIQTAAGSFVFEMRNSSNGYYGGSWEAKFEPRVVDSSEIEDAEHLGEMGHE